LKNFVKIAHRGASGISPENTIAAFNKAIEIGVDAVELDVHMSKDGKIVVCHDSGLNRTTNMKGLISNLNFSDIRNADAGSWFDKKFAGEKIPTLAESLNIMMQADVITVVEVKDRYIAADVVYVIEETNSIDKVVVISFHANVISEVRQINPYISTGFLIGGNDKGDSKKLAVEFVRRTMETGANTLNVSYNYITKDFVYEVRRRGVNLWTWTVDDVETMSKLLNRGVCGITSNYPNRFNLLK